MTILVNDTASAICTAVAIGFALSYNNNHKDNITFEYYDSEDYSDYNDVRELFKAIGVPINIEKVLEKNDLPIIVAKTNHIENRVRAINTTEAELGRKLNKYFSDNAGMPEKNLYGNYIGGFGDISKITLIGCSTLERYAAKHRSVSETHYKIMNDSYRNMYDVAKKVNDNLGNFKASLDLKGDIKLSLVDIKEPEFKKLLFKDKNGKHQLFSSIHGMIRVLEQYGNNKSVMHFEIAAGSKTNKCSSCLPCSIYMTANNLPPTSIHLGRGDYWNVPSKTNTQTKHYRDVWKTSIMDYYNLGIKKLSGIHQSTLQSFDTAITECNIDEYFTEALTFNGTFTSKIKNTL